MQAKAADKPSPFHMQPRGVDKAFNQVTSLVEGSAPLHRSPGISTQHQACNSDSQHIKSACIAFMRRLMANKSLVRYTGSTELSVAEKNRLQYATSTQIQSALAC